MSTVIIYIVDAPTLIIDMASSHRGIGYSKGLVTLLRPRYDTHMRQTRYLIFSTCSWWGFSASTIWILHVPLHSSIQSLFSRSPILSIMILGTCDTYLGTFKHTGGDAPVSIANSCPRIVRRIPFLHKQSKYFLIILMIIILTQQTPYHQFWALFSIRVNLLHDYM